MIKQGAEAKLFLDKFDGQSVIIKDRIKKKYRIEQIDKKIRKIRTSIESNLLTEARRIGVPTPKIVEIDKQNNKIIMEYVDGIRIKEYLNECDIDSAKKISFKIGQLIGKLHSSDIIHGDLTTSNMILKENQIFFIDFGLGFFSKRIEDKGTDLKLMKEALKSTHFNLLNICWDNILKGYRKEYKDANKVLEKVLEIEKRGRYTQKQKQV